MFQLPSERVVHGSLKLKEIVKSFIPAPVLAWYRKVRYGGVMEMYCVPRDKVVEFISAHGGRVLHVVEREAGGGYRSATYYCTGAQDGR